MHSCCWSSNISPCAIVWMLVHLTTRAPPSWSNSCASELFAHHDILDDEQRECIDYFINHIFSSSSRLCTSSITVVITYEYKFPVNFQCKSKRLYISILVSWDVVKLILHVVKVDVIKTAPLMSFRTLFKYTCNRLKRLFIIFELSY